MPVFENLRDAVRKLGEKVRNLGDARKGKEATFSHWNDLQNEIQRNVLAFAVADQNDTWKANQTFTNISRTNQHMWEHLHDPESQTKAMRDFKSTLDAGREVTKAVLKDAFPDKEFSGNRIGWGERTIQHEADALAPVLASCSPKERSEILKSISKLDTGEKLAGYARMLQQADLFPQDKVDDMVSYAAGLFKDSKLSLNNDHRAADVLAIGYDVVSSKVQNKTMNSVRNTIASNTEKRVIFAEEISQANPSLLRHEEFKKLVRKEFRNFESPHKGIAALASYIDKKDQSETDFIIDNSFGFFGANTADGDHNIVAAIAIARVADGNVSPENRDRIEKLRRSDEEGAAELKSTFEWSKPVASPSYPAQLDSKKLELELSAYKTLTGDSRFQNTVNEIDKIGATEDLAHIAGKHMNSARQALMDTERRPRER